MFDQVNYTLKTSREEGCEENIFLHACQKVGLPHPGLLRYFVVWSSLLLLLQLVGWFRKFKCSWIYWHLFLKLFTVLNMRNQPGLCCRQRACSVVLLAQPDSAFGQLLPRACVDEQAGFASRKYTLWSSWPLFWKSRLTTVIQTGSLQQ